MTDAMASPTRIAVATTSGSSGKTTTAVTIAAILAQRGLRVLLVDTDWQMDASRWAGWAEADLPADAATVLTVLQDRTRIKDAIVQAKTLPGVHLLPAAPEMKDVTRIVAGRIGVEQQLRRALDLVVEDYDVVIIDCRAGTELPTIAGLVAATAVIGATQAGMKELRNTLSLHQLVDDIVEGYGRPLTLAGILPCNVPSAGAAYTETLALMDEEFAGQMLPRVRHAVAVTEAHAERMPLTARKRWQAVADDYRAVVDALAERGVLPATASVA